MTLLWSKNNGDKPRRDRGVLRNCGQPLGQLDELLPFLYIAQYGASGRDLRARETVSHPGLFAVGERTGGDRPGVAPRVGLILPLSLCRNERTRAALLAIPALISGQGNMALPERRRLLQARLDEAFGGNVTVAEKEHLDEFFALDPKPGLFRQLHEDFDYITELLDNPAGHAQITKSARFPWRSLGELMEWYHGIGDGRLNAWPQLVPFYVFGNTGALTGYYTDRWARAGLAVPGEDPSKWFVIRPGLLNAEIGIQLEMDQYGWAKLHLSLDASTITIWLSEVFDPFDELVAWGQKIDLGDLPIEMEIDEEGSEMVMTVLCTEDPERVLLRVRRKYSDAIALEGVVSRPALASAMRSELRRFFSSEFDPEHWDHRGGDDEEDEEDGHVSTKDRVTKHPWIKA